MAQIHQSDIILYIRKVLGIKGEDFARRLSAISDGATFFEKDISRIANKKRAGYSGFLPSVVIKEFVDKSIAVKVSTQVYIAKQSDENYNEDEIRKDAIKALYRVTRKFVENNGLEFKNSNLKDIEFEEYIRNMFEEGLANYTIEEEAFVKKDDGITILNQTLAAPEAFTGRKEIIENIHTLLSEKKAIVLKGIGGIGKTFIARHYADTYDYACKQIITCQKSFTSYKQLLLELKLNGLTEEKFSEDEKINSRIRLIKETQEKTLLIFDNVDRFLEDNKMMNDLLLELNNVHIIFTTRLPKGTSVATTIEVDALSEKEQRTLFETHLKQKIEEEDEEYVDKILEKVAGHTFLIELAAKSVAAAYYDYKKIYDYLNREDSEDIPEIIAQKDGTTKNVNLKEMVRVLLFDIGTIEDDKEKEALYLMSLLPLSGIQKRLFGELFASHRNALNKLQGKGWIKEEEQDGIAYVSIHPVICDVIRDEYQPTFRNSFETINVISEYINKDVRKSFYDDLCKLIVSIMDTIDFDDDKLSKDEMLKLEKMIVFLSDNYKYNDALEICKTALDVYENKDSMDDIEYEIYTGLGRLSRRLANYKDAIKYFNKASNCAEEGSINKAKSLRRLGEVYRKDSKYEDALCFDEEAIKIFSKFEAKNEVAEATNAMGVVYINLSGIQDNEESKTEYLEKAMEAYKEAERIWDDIGDPDKQLAFSYHNIGTVYYNLGDFGEAFKQHKKGLNKRISDKLNKTDIASSYAWLCKDCVGLKDFEGAEDYIMDSLKIREEILGKEHPDYAWSLDSYSDILVAQERYDEAVEVMEEVISIRKKVLSLEHKYTQKAIKKLGEIKVKQKI